MGTPFLNQMKKQACSFLQDKYKTARLALTDVTPIELLTEEATNSDPWGPDAKTMTQIAVASFGVDAYWRIIDILHKRLDTVDWKQWRQSYKTLVLLEFLMTHGPEELAEEFHNDIDIIEDLGTFQFIDDKGFDWGAKMHKRSASILALLRGGGTALREARLKALKISKEIQGFGSSTPSSAAASPTSSAATPSSAVSTASFTTAGSTFEDICRLENLALTTNDLDDDAAAVELPDDNINNKNINNESREDTHNGNDHPVIKKTLRLRSHRWDCCGDTVQEKGSLLDVGGDHDDRKPSDQQGLVGGFCDKMMMMTTSPKKNKQYCGEKKNNGNYHNNGNGFRSFSDVGKLLKRRYQRQFSMGY
ncbi:unnamed protein product [Linum trigynum]|uniref:ENTH domain-containing protein n=1 Tax=Linum trigynum TaxID=586398 RepID=A0AAV2GKM7_9ROSI